MLHHDDPTNCSSSSDTVLESSSPSKGRQAKSARLNIMRRPSIYDARMPRAGVQKETRARPLQPKSRSHVNIPLPETQLVSNVNLGKRKRPLEDTQSKRVLRNRIQPNGSGFQQPVFPISDKNPFGAVTRTSAAQQELVDFPLVLQRANVLVQDDFNNQVQAPTTESKKKVTRKAVVPSKPRLNRLPISCLECRKRKQKCDRGRPTCGQCIKRGVQCAYDRPPDDDTQLAGSTQLIAPKKQAPQTSASARQTRPDVNREVVSRAGKSKQPDPLAALHPPTIPSFTPGSSSVGPNRTGKSSGFPIPTPDIPDLQTFLDMQAKGQVV